MLYIRQFCNVKSSLETIFWNQSEVQTLYCFVPITMNIIVTKFQFIHTGGIVSRLIKIFSQSFINGQTYNIWKCWRIVLLWSSTIRFRAKTNNLVHTLDAYYKCKYTELSIKRITWRTIIVKFNYHFRKFVTLVLGLLVKNTIHKSVDNY